ncbi:MAG: acyl-CoA dehydrogenase, partial [Pseudomonadales bacterium]|nr:acyl-CoA dehydrogenase [Pseudomonadales bacterium]
GRVEHESLRDDISQHKMNGEAFSLTVRRAGEEAKSARGPGDTSSMFKYYGTEHNKKRFELMLNVLGSQALGWEGDGFDAHELSTCREWLRSKGNSIEGGTSEVQLNVIAKRVLGLPD